MYRLADRPIARYIIGFVLAAVLTAIPFAVVAGGLLSGPQAYITIAAGAILQVLVHLAFFLHFDLKSTPVENTFFLAFAAVLIVIMVGGSLWIMSDLHHRMM